MHLVQDVIVNNYLPYLLGTSQQYCECLIIRIDVLMKEGMIGEGGRRLYQGHSIVP